MTSQARISPDLGSRFWDGVQRSYIPGPQLDLPPDFPLYETDPADVDPITFEVIRYALMNANLEHTRVIQRLSVSPIVMVARDMQTSILTAVGDLLLLGPNVQYFANSQALATKWVLENRAASTGIGPGDIYLSNDPFVGTAHHQDTNLMMPIFVEGKLFCWISNTLHLADVGGTSPGSFCMGAIDAWSDPPAFPGVRLVEGGILREDIEDLFLRQSRLRVNVQMDLRAAVTAAQTTGRRLQQIIARYDADAVATVMQRMIEGSRDLFRERLRHIPDGRWSARGYVESSIPEDQGIYRYQVNLQKQGDRLIVDNRGTDRQAGAINCTYAAFSGGFLTSAVQALVPELAGCFGGAYSCVEFRAEPGLLNCAEHPAAVSPSGGATSEIGINLSTEVVAKMLGCGDADARARMIGAPQPAFYAHLYAGLDREGRPFVQPCSDNMVGTQGGTIGADGIDAGGAFWMPGAIAENIEQVEDAYPLLYLYRRFQRGGHQGAGRHRGGLGTEVCSVPRQAQHFQIELSFNEAFARANGVSGGNPGGLGATRVVRNADAVSSMREGQLPNSIDAISGEETTVPPKGLGIVADDNSVIWWSCAASPGYGDPLRRSPEACRLDAVKGIFDPAVIADVYGVILRRTDDGFQVDDAATQELRTSRRSARLGRDPGDIVALPEGARAAGDTVHVHSGEWLCGDCGHSLGGTDKPYKAHAYRRDSAIDTFAAGFATPHPDIAMQMEFREFLCPNCGVRMESEIALKTDDPLDDLRLEGV